MYYYSGYTVPLSTAEVYTLLEFGTLKRGEVQLYEHEFILHSYTSGEVQYEFLLRDTVYMYTEADLQRCKACPSGKFKENDQDVIYHLSDYQVYELQVNGLTKLWDQDHDEDIIKIEDFQKYNLGDNFRYVSWLGDILIYFYESDKTEIGSPYYRSL